MNCFFFLDLQGLLFKIGCYFLLSQRMFRICWLPIQFYFSSSHMTRPCYFKHLESRRLHTNQRSVGTQPKAHYCPRDTCGHRASGSHAGFNRGRLVCSSGLRGPQGTRVPVHTQGSDYCWMWWPVCPQLPVTLGG